MNKILNSSVGLLVILCLTNVLLVFSSNFLFISDDLYYQSFGEQLAISRFDEVIELTKKWEWLVYISIPLITIFRIFLCSICLFIGIYFAEIQIAFGKLFKVAILADFVFAFSGLTKLILLIFYKDISTLSDLQFSPFSMHSLLGKESIDPIFEYPMSLLNIFELIYLFVLTWLLKDLLNNNTGNKHKSYSKSLKLVLTSYGSGMFLWVAINMFITISLS